jgi:hypothetical protein
MSISAVTASGFETGNPPENSIDGSMTTRWACQGVGSGIKYDLGYVREITKIKIAFYSGSSRRDYFDIYVSNDNSTLNRPRLSCHDFIDNQVRLQLFALAYNPGNFLQTFGFTNPLRRGGSPCGALGAAGRTAAKDRKRLVMAMS